MNRTLRRPMFRIGGVAEGITSGLSRQGYATNENNRVEQNDFRKMKSSEFFTGDRTMGDIIDASRAVGYKPRGTNVYDFMTEMGLDLASRPAGGNIFQQLATSAKDPYARFMERKQSAAEQEYGSQSDMFKTMLQAQADVLAAKEEGKGKLGKEWLKQWEFDQIPILHDKIAALETSIESGELSDEQQAQAQRDLISAEDQLNEIVELDDVTKAWLKSDEGDRFIQGIRVELWDKDLERRANDEEPKYRDEEDSNLGLDALTVAIKRLKKRRRAVEATGGRVDYQMGGDVMPGQPMQAAGPMDQGPAPEDMAGITYEELRARLPQEITDDIVRLLANSAEALEDFAMIQTEQDINIFNKKYGVTLVLPSEG
jgi:hypothetical protein